MQIQKVARGAGFSRPLLGFPSAREAFKAFLVAADVGPDDVVLLPAFVGWSANEGSGVLDPIRELGLRYRFYPMTEHLRIDRERYAELVERHRPRVVVLIHYFGYVDPAYEEALAVARGAGALVLEDEAHAMLTDLVGGASGRGGDACIFSLHKMLPVPTGGALVFNSPESPVLGRMAGREPGDPQVWAYDLQRIAARRVANAAAIAGELGRFRGDLTPLWPDLPAGTVPQTYPVVVERVDRNEIYFGMNAAGFGVVSLYHTMVSELDAEAFPAAHHLARRILNLPVHQDAGGDDVRAMMDELHRQIQLLRTDDR